MNKAPLFGTNDPLYKLRVRHVWLWKEWLDRPNDVEAGIDLVAEDTEGHLRPTPGEGVGSRPQSRRPN
jgi:predicted helicase